MLWRAYYSLITGDPKTAEQTLLKARSLGVLSDPDEFGMALALAQAMQGRPEIAKEAVRRFASTERFRNEHFIQLCAVSDERDRMIDEISRHTYRREYRWVTREPLLRPYRNYPPFQKLVRNLYKEWQQNLADFGPSLPVPPPTLPDPEQYLYQQ